MAELGKVQADLGKALVQLTNAQSHLIDVQAKQAEVQSKHAEEIELLRKDVLERERRLDERIDKMVSAIGDLISRIPPESLRS
jgi:hypothetical protein